MKRAPTHAPAYRAAVQSQLRPGGAEESDVGIEVGACARSVQFLATAWCEPAHVEGVPAANKTPCVFRLVHIREPTLECWRRGLLPCHDSISFSDRLRSATDLLRPAT